MPRTNPTLLAQEAATKAVNLLQRKFRESDAGILSTEHREIKTRADFASEEVITNHLAKSGLPVIAEETASNVLLEQSGSIWIVDPLDGTMNWTRGFPIAAVSIALWEDGAPQLGVVYDLFRDRIFVAEVGKGAFCNQVPIKVSTVSSPAEAVLATGFPVSRSFASSDLRRFVGQVQSFMKVRMIGSAAMSLAMVAEGVFDAYSEDNIMLWDIAAGLALVKAAGGDFLLKPGSIPNSYRVFATNGSIPPASLACD